MVDVKRQLVIVHPPKTAGQAVQEALGLGRHWITGDDVWRHDTLGEIREKMPEAADWRTALLVRNPYDRLESFYHYTNGGSKHADGPVKQVLESYSSFKEFVENTDFQALFAYASGLHPKQAKLMPMVWYARGGRLEDMITIIRQEKLEAGLQQFVIGPIKVDLVNATNRPSELWTELMRGRVYKAFKEDFDVFGYDSLI